HRRTAQVENGIHAGREGERADEHLTPGADAHELQREVERSGTRAERERPTTAERVREFLLERVHLWPQRRDPVGCERLSHVLLLQLAHVRRREVDALEVRLRHVLRVSLMTLAGTPATQAPGGTSRFTTAPAPTTAPSPTMIPGSTTARAPIRHSQPTCTPPVSAEPGARCVPSPIRQSCSAIAPELTITASPAPASA